MGVLVKICGLTEEEGIDAAIQAGADMVGFVFFPPSPRAVSVEQVAELTQFMPEEIKRVGLFVDPDDALLDQVMNNLRLDLFQFHGNESPERVEAVRLEYGMPIMKAIPVAEEADIARAEAYLGIADWLLFDAKAPKGADRPGGHGISFDWKMLKGRKWGRTPWMLAGGLSAANVAEAVRQSGAKAIDVSSGVESAPGIKDPAKIQALMDALKPLR
jgi:phosphoribosylanthranilate isomerase